MILLRAMTWALLVCSLLFAGCSNDPSDAPSPVVSAPTFSPTPGTFVVAQSVALTTSTAGASIRYTIDNTTPTETTGTLYTGTITVSSTTTIKAIASKTGMANSPVSTGTFTITPAAASDSWLSTSTIAAPSSRQEHKAIWTGSRMIIWGDASGGALYNPADNSWTAMSTTNAPTDTDGSAVWTGSRMIVWGGFASPGFGSNAGAAYDPDTNTWTPIAAPGTLAGRYRHAAAWTGSEMIVWGGCSGGNLYTNTGSAYNPALDSWRDLPTSNGPSARVDAVAVATLGNAVTGTGPLGGNMKVIVWGGHDGTFPQGSGAVYDINSNSWSPMTDTGAPSGRRNHTVIWTGTQVIIWGGGDLSNTANNGARYNPVTDTWNSVTTTGAPVRRCYHTAVWSGTKMIIWGGENATDWVLASGGVYDPSLDEWAATSTTDAPSRRSLHTAVWTGTQMIVWGGNNGGDTGGRYTP